MEFSLSVEVYPSYGTEVPADPVQSLVVPEVLILNIPFITWRIRCFSYQFKTFNKITVSFYICTDPMKTFKDSVLNYLCWIYRYESYLKGHILVQLACDIFLTVNFFSLELRD